VWPKSTRQRRSFRQRDSARRTKHFPSTRCAPTIHIVRVLKIQSEDTSPSSIWRRGDCQRWFPIILSAIVARCSTNCSCCLNCISRCSSSFLDSPNTRWTCCTKIAVSRRRRCGHAFMLLPYWFVVHRRPDACPQPRRLLYAQFAARIRTKVRRLTSWNICLTDAWKPHGPRRQAFCYASDPTDRERVYRCFQLQKRAVCHRRAR
jgi:hypothetical protein